MKNRVENLFLTKIRATFVLSNVGFPTLIDLTNLTREIPCREARVSSLYMAMSPRWGGYCAGAADSAPGLRIPICITGGGACTGPCRRGRRTGPFQTGRTDPLPGRGVQVLCKQGARALPEGRGVQVLCRDSARCGRLRKAGAEGIRRRVQKKRAFSRGKSDIFFYFCINWENSELKCRSCMTRRM